MGAALAILESEGPQAVTMRRVAAVLDTGPASIYVYVAGREGLLQAMLDRVVATIELPRPDPGRWRAQLHELLERMRQALVAHPGVASLTLADRPPTEAILRLAENLLAILLAGGISPQAAAWGCDLLTLLVTAIAGETDVRRARGSANHGSWTEAVAGLYKTFVSLPPDRFPSLNAHAAEMVAGDGDERFHYAIDVVLDGLMARPEGRPDRTRD